MQFFSQMFEKFAELSPNTIAVLALLVLIGVGGTIIIRKSRQVNFTTRMLVFASICIALSFVLSYIRLARMPQGGSITPASMLPVMAFAYIFGPVPGVIAGIAYGFLQFIQDSYLVHWIQLFIDYPIAFGCLGLAGLFRKNFRLGILIAVLGRFLMHFLTGIIFFAEYAGDQHVVLYSLGYNGSYLAVELAICLIIVSLPQVKNMLNQLQTRYGSKEKVNI
jgi:thiamine transporter